MKVLIVEDNPSVQRMYGKALEFAGFTVVVANDGNVALEMAQREKPDVILMDVMMPVMNGLDALKLLKADDQAKTIPVIMLSAFEDDNLVIEAMSIGASRYLVKSNNEPKQIIDVIKEVTGSAAEPAA